MVRRRSWSRQSSIPEIASHRLLAAENPETAVRLDLEKSAFQLHGSDRTIRPVVREKIRRGQVLTFFADLPPCLIGLV